MIKRYCVLFCLIILVKSIKCCELRKLAPRKPYDDYHVEQHRYIKNMLMARATIAINGAKKEVENEAKKKMPKKPFVACPGNGYGAQRYRAHVAAPGYNLGYNNVEARLKMQRMAVKPKVPDYSIPRNSMIKLEWSSQRARSFRLESAYSKYDWDDLSQLLGCRYGCFEHEINELRSMLTAECVERLDAYFKLYEHVD